jgi:alpha-L-rhamnosidase
MLHCLLISAALLTLFFLLSTCVLPFCPPQEEWRVSRLLCEFLDTPLGIDTLQPRLSWIVESDRRGARQTAFRILVAAGLDKLDADEGNLWDSGRIESNQTAHVHYDGLPLASGCVCYWKVRAWDENGAPSEWSKPARWEMGLLDRSDWQAAWIGFATEPQAQAVPLVEGSKWIWITGDEPHEKQRNVFFRRPFDLPENAEVVSARLAITADNAWSLFVNGREIEPQGEENERWENLQEFDLTASLKEGANLVAVDVFNREGPGGFLATLEIRLEDAPVRTIRTDGSWRVAGEGAAGWEAPAFDDGAWAAAVEVGRYGEEPWGDLGISDPAAPCPFLRRDFSVGKTVAQARLHTTALGVYEMHLNGERVGKARFVPGWTDYRKRIQYQSCDVTRLVGQGTNTLGAVLGDGWYAGALGWELKRHCYGPYPLGLLAQIRIDYTDGTSETIVTDQEWKGSPGPILFSDFLAGEEYDARLEEPGWSRPGFDDASWGPVELLDAPAAALTAQHSPTVQPQIELKPVDMTEPAPGEYVFDMGQNMVGWVRLAVTGPAGRSVRLRFAEMLKPDGTIYTENLRRARCTDVYTLKGGGEEVFEPHFTFHGFRYVAVTGFPGRPGPDALTGIVAHSATPRSGTFSCSSAMVNRLYENVVWGQRGNFISVPTDCPQRDERLGWLGDAQIFAPTACCNMDVAAFFSKWMKDVEDAQSWKGGFPDVAPRMVTLLDGAPAWGDAGIIVPWTCLLFYGDRGLVSRHFVAMEKWINYILDANPTLLRTERVNNNYGDWVSLDADTPKDVLATAYFAHCADLMARMAGFLGREEDRTRYAGLFDRIRAAFNEAFVEADGRVEGETQSAYVLALAFDLLPEEKRAAAVERLVHDIVAERKGHVSTGFLGVGHILPVLTRFGRHDVACRLLTNETYPSWGYSIRNGATTIWERWDGWTGEKGFQTPGMNSFNHYAFGSVGAWLFASIAGIAPDPERPGFERIRIAPRPGGGLTRASASLDTIRGTVRSAWRKKGGRFFLDLTIPANCTAALRVPADSAAGIFEGGRPVLETGGVALLSRDKEAALFEVASGVYSFEVKPGKN